MRPIRRHTNANALSWSAIVCSHRSIATRTLPLASKINVLDLAKGVSAPEYPDVSSVDMNWFTFIKHKVMQQQQGGVGAVNLNVDMAAKDRIVEAQREAAMRDLPAGVAKRLPTAQGAASTAPGELPKYSTVKATLDAADPQRPTTEGSSSDASTSGANRSGSQGYVSIGSQLDTTPSLSISPSATSSEAIITPAQIRVMFKESVMARTVANTALRKYIKTLNARDYSLAVAAFDGSREGGLKIDADTYGELLQMLLAAQQLRAGMELYQAMLKDRNPPNTHAYNALMKLCVDRGAVDTSLRLYDEMPAKGRAHDKLSYEIAMTAISKQDHPVDWQKAIQIFEKATAGAVDNNGVPFEADAAEEQSAEQGATNGRRGRRRDLLDTVGGDVSAPADYVAPANSQPLVGGFVGGRHAHRNQATASTYNALMKVYLAMQPFEWRVVYNCYYEMRNSKPKVHITWESYHLVRDAMRRGEASRTRRFITYIDAWIQLTSIGSARFMMGFVTYVTAIGVLKLVLGYFFTDRVEQAQDVGLNVENELPVGHETIAVGLGGKPSRVNNG